MMSSRSFSMMPSHRPYKTQPPSDAFSLRVPSHRSRYCIGKAQRKNSRTQAIVSSSAGLNLLPDWPSPRRSWSLSFGGVRGEECGVETLLRCLDPLKPCGAVHIARERSVPQVTLSLRGFSLPLCSSFAARFGRSPRVFCGRHDASEQLIVTLTGPRRRRHFL